MYQLIKMPLACLLIMAYTDLYYYKKRKLNTRSCKIFNVLLVAAMIHIAAAVITEYTVNHRDTVPAAFNYVWHVIFLVSLTGACGLLFEYLLLYVERGSGRQKRAQKTVLFTICTAGILCEIVLPIRYVDTEYGSYSYGMKAYALYAVVIYTMLMMVITIFRYRDVLEKDKSNALLASVFIFVAAALIQIAYPHILLTGLAITMIVLGLMVNTEDAHLYISYNTGLYNELGCREVLQELLLLKDTFPVGVYVFLGGSSHIAGAMQFVQQSLPEKKHRVICGTLADNVLIVLPVGTIAKGICFPDELPQVDCADGRLICKTEIFRFRCGEKVTDILDAVQHFKEQCEENALQRDELTGLLRRAAFIRQIEYMIANDHSFTFMMLDLDDFKSINDLYGHHTGDEALKCVGEALRTALRSSDVICRIGGDEFAVAVYEVTQREVICEIVDRIRNELAGQKLLSDKEHTIKLSFGAKVNLAEEGRPSFQELYAEADAALYRAKHAGKDRLFFA